MKLASHAGNLACYASHAYYAQNYASIIGTIYPTVNLALFAIYIFASICHCNNSTAQLWFLDVNAIDISLLAMSSSTSHHSTTIQGFTA